MRNRCGDGVRAGFEECDDGNEIDGDECTERCRIATCGSPGNSRDCDAGQRLSVSVHVEEVGDATTICLVVTGVSALPLETSLGGALQLTGFVSSTDGALYEWSGSGGTLDVAASDATSFRCVAEGHHELWFTVSRFGCESSAMSTTVTCTGASSTSVATPGGG